MFNITGREEDEISVSKVSLIEYREAKSLQAFCALTFFQVFLMVLKLPEFLKREKMNKLGHLLIRIFIFLLSERTFKMICLLKKIKKNII